MTRTTKLMLGIMIWTTACVQAYVPLMSSSGREVIWASGHSVPIPYYINVGGVGNATTNTIFNQAIRSSFQTWENVETSSISYSYRGTTENEGGSLDGINVVDFSRGNALFSDVGYTEVIGLTLISFDTTGYITEADIILNTAGYPFSTTQETNLGYTISATGSIRITGAVNLKNIATHEIGHFSGLGHSYIDGNVDSVQFDQFGSFQGPYPDVKSLATMYPFELNGSETRTLEADDIAGISHLYPTSTFLASTGAIEGKIVSAADPTEPVFGAHVVVVNNLDQEQIGACSDKDGTFRIEGLDPDDSPYTLFAERIPWLYTASSYWQTAEQQFPQEFYDDQYEIGKAEPFTVRANAIISGIQHTVLVGFDDYDQNEPNNSFLEFTDANPDITIAGVIDKPQSGVADKDIFRFRALRGSLIRVEVLAQRMNTLMKPVITIYDSDEIPRAQNSDFYGLEGDARIDFRVPMGGFYFIKVEHSSSNEGGDGYYYQLSVKALEKVVPISPSSDLIPALSFELTSAQVLGVENNRQLRLKEINISLQDFGQPSGYFTASDIADIVGNSILSGVNLFYDNSRNGRFDYRPDRPNSSDVLLEFDQATIVPGNNEILVSIPLKESFNTVLPFNPIGKANFHVVIRTSPTLHLGDDFKVSIPAGGLILVDASNKEVRAFDQAIPEYPSIFTGDLLKLVSMTDVEQRIGLDPEPTAVIGINAIGDPSKKYYLSEVKFWVVGYSARNFVPFFIDRIRYVAAPDNIIRATGSYGDFTIDDLQKIAYQDQYKGGGIALYRDKANQPSGGEYEGAGTFNPGIDLAIPFGSPTYKELSIKKVPQEFLDALSPRLLGLELFSYGYSYGYDFAKDLNVQAFEVSLKLEESDLTRIPSTDTGANEGADFFVGIQMSNSARALDSFMVLIPDEGIRIKDNYGNSDLSRERPSLSYFDPTLESEVIDPITVRPFPRVDVNDLTKVSPNNRVLPLASEGGNPKAVMGFNMTDFGMSTHIIPQGPGVEDIGIFFNQGYIWDSLILDFVPVDDFERNDLREVTNTAFYSNNTVFFGHGVAIFCDDDTPVGDFIDNDGDGLIDEETKNGRDDDLDGVVDEEDFGDEDVESQSGVFDRLDYNDFWPPLTFNRYRHIDFTNEAQFATAPTFPNTPEVGGNYRATFELEAVRLREEALSYDDFIYDPWTFSPQNLFIRTGFSPIWYRPEPVLSDFSLANSGNDITQVGFYITLGNDEEDYQEMIDTYDADRADEFEYTYHHVFPIPDEDGGENYEFLEGDDVFVVLRASGTAESGDRFKVQIPQDAFAFSVYQSPDVDLNVQNGNPSFPFSFPSAAITSSEIAIGSQNQAPAVSIITPAEGRNFFGNDFEYEIVFAVDDPDSTNVEVNLYLDNNNLGFDGIQLNTTPLMASQSKFQFSLTDPWIFEQLKDRFGIVDVRRLTEQDTFYVYLTANDRINEKVSVYSNGYITIDKDLVEDLAEYLKLDSDGVIYETIGSGRFRSIPVDSTARAVDMEVLLSENGLLALRSDGRVYGRSDPGTTLGAFEKYRKYSFDFEEQDRIVFPDEPTALANKAIDLEIYEPGPGYYILDELGGIHTVGNLRDFASSAYNPPFFSWDIARDMQLTNSGEGLIILDGYGGVHYVGDVTWFSEFPKYYGSDVARDLQLTSSENGYYVLTNFGEIVAVGDAQSNVAIEGIEPDISNNLGFVSLKSNPECDGFLVMAASGEVTPILNARVGSDINLNPLENNFVDLEVIGLTEGNAEELIRSYFEAYAKEEVQKILSLLSTSYLDDHGNNRELLEASLRQIFDYYIVGLPTENPMVIDDIQVQVSSAEATVIASVIMSHRIPTYITMAVGDDFLTMIMPFSQTVQIIELQDGRNDRLSVYDLDNPSGVFDPAYPYRDRKIFEKVFTRAGIEGPYKLYLKYEGVGEDSAYIFTLEDGDNLGNTLQPSDVRVARYLPEGIYSATDATQFEFTLVRETSTGGFRIQKADILQLLPTYAEETNPIGFSFARRGPVADFQFLADDVDGNYLFGAADFRVTGGDDTGDAATLAVAHSIPGFQGVVNLTDVLGITDFDQFRTKDFKDIPTYQFSNSENLFIDQIYLIITKDQKRYGLIRPVRLSLSAELEGTVAVIFDWKYLPDQYVITK